MTTKKCARCQEVKSTSEFTLLSSSGRYHTYCRPCANQIQRDRKAAMELPMTRKLQAWLAMGFKEGANVFKSKPGEIVELGLMRNREITVIEKKESGEFIEVHLFEELEKATDKIKEITGTKVLTDEGTLDRGNLYTPPPKQKKVRTYVKKEININPEYLKIYRRQYYQKTKKSKRDYYDKNKDKIKQYCKERNQQLKPMRDEYREENQRIRDEERRLRMEEREREKEEAARLKAEEKKRKKEETIRKRKEYLEKNKEALRKKRREYYDRNKELMRERTRKYYQENAEAVKEKFKKRYEENAEVLREKSRKAKQEKKQEKNNNSI